MNNNEEKDIIERLSIKSREVNSFDENVKNKIKDRYKEKLIEDKLIYVKFKNNNKKYYLVSSLALTSMILLFILPVKNNDLKYDILTSPIIDTNQNPESIPSDIASSRDLAQLPASQSLSKMAPWYFGAQNSHFINNLNEIKSTPDTKLYKINNLEISEDKINNLIDFFSIKNNNTSTDQYYKQYISNTKSLSIYTYPESLASWSFYDSSNDPYRCNIPGTSPSYPENTSEKINDSKNEPNNDGIISGIAKSTTSQEMLTYPTSNLKCNISTLPNDKDVIKKTSILIENLYSKDNIYKYSLYRDTNQVIVYATPYIEKQAINSLQITIVFTANGIYSASGTNYSVDIPKPVSIISANEAIIRANDSRYLAQEYYQEQVITYDSMISSESTINSDLTIAKKENKKTDKLYHPIYTHNIIKAIIIYNNYYQFGENILAPVWLLESSEGRKFTVLALASDHLETYPQDINQNIRPLYK